MLLEERPSHPGLSRLRILRTLIRRVVDRAPIYVDRDLSKEPSATHAKILAPADRCQSFPKPEKPQQPHSLPRLQLPPLRGRVPPASHR